MNELMHKYLQGRTTEQERKELLARIRSDEQIDKWLRADMEFSDSQMPQPVQERILHNIMEQRREPVRRSLRSGYAYYWMAACISLFVVVCHAQNMKVVGFNELVNDLTANRHGTSMTDDNGETAALIKIVTPETGFSFDGGSLGIVSVVQKPGEIWLYVPPRAQRLTISHRDFGVLRNYAYSVPIEGAKTYEMLLDIGTGCYATITAPVAKSKVYIDNNLVGTVPVYNKYLNYGKHVIRVVNDKLEGTVESVITSDKKSVNIDVEMTDMSHLYGDVRVLVENNADIIFGGEKVANGIWDTQLK